jgi:hypothetical protein
MSRETYELSAMDGSGDIRRRSLTVNGMADGDPFNPVYFTVPADPDLSLEEALSLAQRLFGAKHTTVTETITLQKVARNG